MRQALAKQQPTTRLFLHRANWDGQGNWSYESPDEHLTDQLVRGFDAKLHWHPEAAKLVPKYFRDHATAVHNLRKVRDLVFVDVGGVPQPEKHPVVQACSHYLVISRYPEAIADWHRLCTPDLPCLAVIHSESDAEPDCVSSYPLTFKVGLKAMAETGAVPEALINQVVQLVLPGLS